VANPLKPKRKPASILSSTIADEEETMETAMGDETYVEEQKDAGPPSLALPPGPSVKRRRHKGLRFVDIYETRSLSIDKRLLPYFDDFMESGDTKTQVANQLVLKILLEAGYAVDPQILTKPIIKPE
jgi:hypothetical protein